MSLPAFFITFLFLALKYSNNKLKLTYKKAIKFASGFAVIVIPFVIFFTIFTDKFLQYIYFFHLDRISYSFQVKFEQFLIIFNMDKLLFLLPLVLIYFAYTKKTRIFFALVLAYFLFIFNLPIFFENYFLMILPFLAVIIAVGVSNLLKKLISLRINQGILLVLLLIALLLFFIPIGKYTNEQYQKVYNEPNLSSFTMDWLADYIRTHSNSDELIFGPQPHTAEIALRADRKIALDFPITQIDYFENNPDNTRVMIEKLSELIDAKKLKFIVGTEVSYLKNIQLLPEYQSFVENKCGNVVVSDIMFENKRFENKVINLFSINQCY